MRTVNSKSNKTRVTQIRWPNAKQGPYLISGQWRFLQGRWQMVSYSQSFANEKDMRELQTEDARALRLPAIRTQSAVELRRQLEARRRRACRAAITATVVARAVPP